jgi:hypothetical protein
MSESTVQELMNKITNLQIEPHVFKVILIATDHTYGFSAHVDFRSNYSNDANISHLATSGDSPEDALQDLYNSLVAKFGPCRYCGRTGPVELDGKNE